MATKVYIARLSLYTAEDLRTEYEKIRARFISVGLRRIAHRDENLLGRLMLDKAMQSLSAGDYTVEYRGNDKPVLINGNGLYFNISHSGDYVALALSDREVGCDIQEIRPYSPRVAKRNYCEKETEFIENSDNKDESFIRLWALKESVLKFDGSGIAGGLSNYDFSPYAGENEFTAFGCNFYVEKIENTYFALCHKNPQFEIETMYV